MRHLSKEEWEVSPKENVIHTTLPNGFEKAFSPNTDKERAKLIEAAPKMYKYILDRCGSDSIAWVLLKELGL